MSLQCFNASSDKPANGAIPQQSSAKKPMSSNSDTTSTAFSLDADEDRIESDWVKLERSQSVEEQAQV